MDYILGIDTSNYKTSIAVVDREKHIICDLRRFLTVKQGERGLRQSDALFQHIQNLPALMEEMRELNVLQNNGEHGYRFTHFSFFQMMGTKAYLEQELEKYMGDSDE